MTAVLTCPARCQSLSLSAHALLSTRQQPVSAQVSLTALILVAASSTGGSVLESSTPCTSPTGQSSTSRQQDVTVILNPCNSSSSNKERRAGRGPLQTKKQPSMCFRAISGDTGADGFFFKRIFFICQVALACRSLKSSARSPIANFTTSNI